MIHLVKFMRRNISFYIKLLLVTIFLIGSLYAAELSIIPLKKPILDAVTKQNKLTQGIIRPKSKPVKKIEKQKLSKEIIKPESKPSKQAKEITTKVIEKPESKPSKQAKEITTKVIEKKVKKIDFLKPKSKPLEVKKTSTAKKTK